MDQGIMVLSDALKTDVDGEDSGGGIYRCRALVIQALKLQRTCGGWNHGLKGRNCHARGYLAENQFSRCRAKCKGFASSEERTRFCCDETALECVKWCVCVRLVEWCFLGYWWSCDISIGTSFGR